ncbi:MAG: DeoR/GlpR family DNA-binding transcription regulator [Rectinemataceae bacterium]|jgi:DeoR family ulaG and ulaABCDEF operon transcriptional repressor
MLERERKETILRLLDLRTFANIHDIVESTGASEATVRRDFIEMEKGKLLRRVRGGVELIREADERREPSLDRRMSVNLAKKRRIAKQACSYIASGETVIIDGGSTTFQMTEHLSRLPITVVTNSFAIIQHLVRHSNCRVILPEGIIDPNSQLILNNLSPDPFANYHASTAFMGIEGISETELTNTEPLLIQMERSMISHARELVILADETKFGAIGHLVLCPAERATRIVTTKEADPELVSRLRDKGVEIVMV